MNSRRKPPRRKGRETISLLQAYGSERHDLANDWLLWATGEGTRRQFIRATAASECVTLGDDAKREIAKRLGLEVSK
jgi:hypothetical protein